MMLPPRFSSSFPSQTCTRARAATATLSSVKPRYACTLLCPLGFWPGCELTGDPEVEDTATQGLNAPFAPQAAPAQGGAEEDDDDVPALEAVEDEDENAPVDETGIDAREIEMVMSQVRCQNMFISALVLTCISSSAIAAAPRQSGC